MSFRAPMDLRAGSPVNNTQGPGGGTPPASLRLVQPHPAFATRLRSRSDTQGHGPGANSPTYTRYHHRPLLLGSSAAVAAASGEGTPPVERDNRPSAHAHTTSDIENQMPPSFRATRERGHSPARGKAGYGYGHGRGGEAYASPDHRYTHAQQHSFSHPATNAGSSRNGNIAPGGPADDLPAWHVAAPDIDRSAESSTPRASGSGVMEDGLVRGDLAAGPIALGEPLARYDTSSSSIRSDGESETHHGMPPISLGVLRHRRQASSMDIPDGPNPGPTFGGSTPAVMMRAPSASGGTTAGNERAILQELANSKDEGDTLDLSRKGIERITEEDARLLRYGVGKQSKGVWRLALSYNRLRHFSFDQSMSTLGRLRYLNLKGNNLTELPPVLTAMPSLEILDVSKNAIINLPDDPGRLVQLRVLSLTRNKLNRLPSYLAYFANLRVLKVEDNPIEWPPREILEMRHVPLAAPDDPSPALKPKEDDMRVWIATVKDWMRNQEQEQIRLQAEGIHGSATSPPSPSGSLSSFNAATSAPETEMPMTPADDVSSDSWKGPTEQPAQSPSLQLKELSITPTQPWLRNRRRANSNSPTVMPLLSPVMARSTSNGPIPLVVRQAPSPLAQTPPAFPPVHAQLERENSSGSTRTVKDNDAPTHARGSSYNGEHRMSANLSSKKSLPDLRQGLSLGMTSPGGPSVSPRGTAILGETSPRAMTGIRRLSSKPSMPLLQAIEASERRPSLGRKTSDDLLKATAQVKAVDRPGGIAGLANERHPLAIDSRNSYFRRLSTLPASSISKAVPTSLLRYIDAARGLLFAISQSYAALRQYLASSSQERVAGVFMRVMDPAAAYMDLLINALDRFDSMTRRRMPTASTIRQVLECCRDNVQVFAKVVAVLELQITALADADDPRYTKTLLLLLYGSLAEISSSWQTMAPLQHEIRELLHLEALPPTSSVPSAHRAGSSISSISRTPISPIMEKLETSPAKPSPATVTHASPASPSRRVITAETTPTRPHPASREKSRRNAGSFSSEDVQMGMMLGPNDALATSTGDDSVDSGLMIPPPRGGRREVKLPPDGPVLEEDEERDLAGLCQPQPVWTHPRRSASDDVTMNTPVLDDSPLEPPRPPFAQRHGQSSSTGRLASLGGTASHRQMGPAYGEITPPAPPTPGSAATLVDEGVLDTLEQASDLAYTVWLRLTEDLPRDEHGAMSKRVEDLLVSLGAAEELTRKLRESLMEVRAYDAEAASLHWTPAGSSGSSARSLIPAQARLSNDAQAFIRIVVRVSEQIIALQTSREHVFPLAIKTLLAKLTSKTRECGILMQVSTLKPANSDATGSGHGSSSASSAAGSRPFSPAFGYNQHQPGSSTDLAGPASAGLQGSASGHGHARQQQMLSRSRSAGVVPT